MLFFITAKTTAMVRHSQYMYYFVKLAGICSFKWQDKFQLLKSDKTCDKIKGHTMPTHAVWK